MFWHATLSAGRSSFKFMVSFSLELKWLYLHLPIHVCVHMCESPSTNVVKISQFWMFLNEERVILKVNISAITKNIYICLSGFAISNSGDLVKSTFQVVRGFDLKLLCHNTWHLTWPVKWWRQPVEAQGRGRGAGWHHTEDTGHRSHSTNLIAALLLCSCHWWICQNRSEEARQNAVFAGLPANTAPCGGKAENLMLTKHCIH